ncbi:MAG: peptide chain release factor N(5)-glutamine methyltransferase [Pseudonocardia sp.]
MLWIGAGERELARAGVASPRVDAELLAAHVLGVRRSRLVAAVEPDPARLADYRALIARRAAREPVQHLLGTAPMGPVEVAVGPGVFVPRLETELLLEWGLHAIRRLGTPCVVDLCTGSGALAAAVAASRPDAQVHAVELDESALVWARRNLPGRVRLVHGDVTDAGLLPELHGRVDLVLANPPYVPEGTPVPPEVGQHDPHRAVFAGPDGLAVIRPMVLLVARLLRPGGLVAIEHDDTHADAAPALLRGQPGLADVMEHPDLAGRPRFVTARAVSGRAVSARAVSGRADGPEPGPLSRR